MRHGFDDQKMVASIGSEELPRRDVMRLLVNGVVVVTMCAFVAACGNTTKNARSGKRSKEYFAESKYGVSASPRVVNKGKVPSGGGRYLVGKPYKVAGKWYKPREVKSYTKVGSASWYGSAFHGRLTANGEVYDMNRLSAAHTTLPLPSYVRVTNMANKRSVVVRVNDRGPFHGRREIDLSKRTAELLDFKRSGTAKVKVEYVGLAPLHGRDHEQLMASYRGPGETVPGGTMPGTMVASAGDTPPAPAAVAAPPALLVANAIPRERPFGGLQAYTEVAFDPAAAYLDTDSNVMIAEAGAQPAPSATSATGTYNPQSLPADSEVSPLVSDLPKEAGTVHKVRTVALRAPSADAPRPVQTVAVSAPPAVMRTASTSTPLAPLPRAEVGTLGTLPAATGGPFVPLAASQVSANGGVSAGGLFYGRPDRISAGHAVIAEMVGGNGLPMRALSARLAQHRTGGARIQLGIFGNSESVARLELQLAHLGRVDRKTVTVKGVPMTALALTGLKAGVSADAAIEAAERLGARGAYLVQ